MNNKIHEKRCQAFFNDRNSAVLAVALVLFSSLLWEAIGGELSEKNEKVSSCVGKCCKCRIIRRNRGRHANGFQCSAAHVTSAANLSQPAKAWRSLFDGKSLANWRSAQFGGEGEVRVENGEIVLEMGDSLTGITFQGELPKINYEVSLEAKKVEGIDFFCGLTFPVAQSHCSFIVGGWAGAVVGLSSIDRRDASENETTRYMNFKTGQWYRIRVRVTPKKIEAWIDDKKVVDQSIVGRKISTRNEVDLSRPLGISAWQTTASLRKIMLRELPGNQ